MGGRKKKRKRRRGRHCVGGKGEWLEGRTKVNLIGRAEQPHEAFFFLIPIHFVGPAQKNAVFFIPFTCHHCTSIFPLAVPFFLYIHTHTPFYSVTRLKVITESMALKFSPIALQL